MRAAAITEPTRARVPYTSTPRGFDRLCHQESTNSPESHEWNTLAHLVDYEGNPDRRPMTREEVQAFLDYADGQVERAIRLGRKGALAAYRDATIFKVIYGWGLRVTETCKLDLADLHRNPHAPEFGKLGRCMCGGASQARDLRRSGGWWPA
jgi:integrase